MTECAYFEDFRVGDRVVSPARTITETDIVLFAALTGDWQAIHTDAIYAKHTMFGERIAHGLLTLAISGGLMFQAGDRGVPRSTIVLYWDRKGPLPHPNQDWRYNSCRGGGAAGWSHRRAARSHYGRPLYAKPTRGRGSHIHEQASHRSSTIDFRTD